MADDGAADQSSSVDVRPLVTLLSSCKLDVAPPTIRASVVKRATDIVTNGVEARRELSDGLGIEAAARCNSPHSYRRIASLLATALVVHADYVVCEHHPTVADDSKLLGLCRSLCRVLGASTNIAALDECASLIVEELSSRDCCVESLRALVQPLLSVATDGAVAAEKGGMKRVVDVGPALSLLDGIVTTLNYGASATSDEVKKWREEMLQLFLRSTLTGGRFAPSVEIRMFGIFLSSMTQGEFDKFIAPVLGLKLRANPDSSIGTSNALLSVLVDSGSDIDVTVHLEGETKLLATGMRQIRSDKEMGTVASSFLVSLTLLTGGGSKSSTAVSTVVRSLTDALVSAKPAHAFSTPGQRLLAYQALKQIGSNQLNNATEFSDKEKELLFSVADATLGALSRALSKDTDGDAASSGFDALLIWMRLQRRVGTKSDGYGSALGYIVQPVLNPKQTSSVTAEYRSRMGSLLTSSLPDDFVESVILDLFQHEEKLEAGLVSQIDNAVKKHTSSAAVAQIDGLIAVFFLLTNSSASSADLPPSVTKVLSAGSSIKAAKTSFLYSQAMNNALSSNELVRHVLHRAIAMYVKIVSNESDERGGDRAQDGLIRLNDKGKPSTAAITLASCVVNPSSSSFRISGTSPLDRISSTIKKIVTYSNPESRAADAIVVSLFSLVNELALQDESEGATLNETREARENYEPVNMSMTKLPLVKGKHSPTSAHKGFDPNVVRRIATLLANSAINVDSMCKALVLTHTGTTMKLTGSRQREALVTATIQLLRERIIPLSKEDEYALLAAALARFISLCSSSQQVVMKDDAMEGSTSKALENAHQDANSLKRVAESGKSDRNSPPSHNADSDDGALIISCVIHEAALSLISSLGAIGGNFDPEYGNETNEDEEPYAFSYRICVKDLSVRFASTLMTSLEDVRSLEAKDVALFRSPSGILFVGGSGPTAPSLEQSSAADVSKNAVKKRAVRSRKGRGDFGAGFEEEEWERQMKKELAAKSKSSSSTSGAERLTVPLTSEEKRLLASQSIERKRISYLLEGNFPRTLAAIRALCSSEIEVGNACLPALYKSVISSVVIECEAMRNTKNGFDGLREYCFDTLCALASCVYEIDEVHSSTLARALAICFKQTGEGHENMMESGAALTINPLPSPCAPAACAIFEMDAIGECLSGSSFLFLFPIIKAALTGPRTTPGCEAAIRILWRHTAVLASNGAGYEIVRSMRKDMASAVLELLSHDRSQTFTDPTPSDALVSCYNIDTSADPGGLALTSAELAPLLGDTGALGVKNCRIASMLALASIASQQPHRLKGNPLIENRIWVNCFDQNESIKKEARKTWRVVNGTEEDANSDGPLPAPSKMYAVPLIPLLSHSDSSIANAAAAAFAHAVGMHQDTAEKSVVRLCSTFIDSYPTSSTSKADASGSGSVPPSSSSPLHPVPAAAPKKSKVKRIDTGLPKKPAKKKTVGGTSLSKLTATTKPKKKVVGGKSISSRTVKPKIPQAKERTFDKELLESQFQTGVSTKKIEERDDETKVSTRLGIVRSIMALSDRSANIVLDLPVLKVTVAFLMTYGLADGSEAVRNCARDASREIVAAYGASDEAIEFLLPHFESILSTGQPDVSYLGSLSKEKAPKDVSASDRRKEGVVVALGSVALHLSGEENEKKIDETIDMLLDALKTPSEDVQSSVAACLSKLMKKGRTQDRIEAILTSLINDCLGGDKLATRRGAAYGISAVVKGSGIATLKKYEIVKQLEDACVNGPSSAKEGALFAIELLCDRLALLFEPYVIVLLPSLLKAFSDSSDHVRMAASHTAGLIMSKLSAHGVKLVMPAVLTAFDDPNWRTKQASIHMLGSMSHCAPKQLATSLPRIVPKLTEAFTDTHPRVKASAEEALDEISKVIRNPEIASISPILLKALIDPATGTLNGLETLIETEFLHAIDAPSLALIVPVLHRGLRDRAATTKRYGALIAGNICTMIHDPRDFVPYLSTLLPDLKSVLLDPIPDVRSTAAKALGSLSRGLGEDTFPELRPWLIETLQAEGGSSVERSGAAQGLTEVLIAGGAGLVEDVMLEEILPLKSHPKPGTREGVLWVLTFMPASLGQGFASLIDPSLPALLSGLADEVESVRDVALRAGRVLVRSQGKPHIDKILPPLENGLSDDDYRIRVASLTLLGDLLGMLGGTKVVKGDADTQDDVRAAERAQAQIALVLGSDTRKRLLSRLYLTRSDTAAVVRQISVQVWKTVVSVTPRTLREILPVLVGQIVDALASGHPEQTEVAGRCLGDIVGKLGDAVLPEIMPVLQAALSSGDEHTRRGVCVGLSEIINCSSKDQISKYLAILVKSVQDALCDEDNGVREMAALCFQGLYGLVGSRALDEVVPVLLSSMESEDEDEKVRAVNGLTGILSIRSRELLPYLIPRLMTKPITKSHADALGQIAAVTGSTLHMHFSTIIPGLISELASFYGREVDGEEKPREDAIRECSRAVCGSVDEIGVNWLISEAASSCGSDKESLRKESCVMLQVIVEERENDFYEQLPIILRELLYRLNDDSTEVLKANHQALGALSKHVPAEELVKHIDFIRNLIASMVSDARRRKGGVGDGEFLMPGFNIQKGLEPLLPIYQRGILYGNASIRETSAAGLGELIALTSTKFLAPLLIKMTGPLLRVVGDRNPSEVKIAIIQTLGLILTKGGPALRAFVPQFQTTFVKALSDPSRRVRVEAIKALALLMPISTRLDPLIKELVTGSLGKGAASSTETAGAVTIQTATLEALSVVLRHGGEKARLPASIPSALNAGTELMTNEDEGVRESAAKVIGAACGLLGVDVTSDFIADAILNDSGRDSGESRHCKAHCIHRILASPVGTELDEATHAELLALTKALLIDDNRKVREGACVAIGAVLGRASRISECLSEAESSLLKAMDLQEPMEIHQAVAKGLSVAVRLNPDVLAGEKGLSLLDASLKLAMSGVQRVQYSFNDFLWLALDVQSGEGGLESYLEIASYENSRTMKTLFTKVLVRMKGVSDDEII
eukprot:CAMPEP_0178537748 /NCGR_PEP_ID=MMETSP0696-20121128/36753_1 /TAXON_ID=265572 /ORGANISM="Extubocellulus spinifer, Strain CCMP396" /LENGTH=3016 /DNA_ID=CAMNT_0020169993 /DNA_START=19 /DNA_END=9069 /DNA_ORIENTATION=-